MDGDLLTVEYPSAFRSSLEHDVFDTISSNLDAFAIHQGYTVEDAQWFGGRGGKERGQLQDGYFLSLLVFLHYLQ